MRVAILGAGTGEVAFLAAERVGEGGEVLAVDEDAHVAAQAKRRAREQCFERVFFGTGGLDELEASAPFDAVIGRFYLMRERDPVAAIRRSARLVRSGGRIVFADWHFESMRWPQASAWPEQPVYRSVANWALEGLRRSGMHVDMGLRLVNAFAEAGLPLPAVRMDLRACGGASAGFDFFAETLRGVLPALERHGIATAAQIEIATLAQRMRQEAFEAGGHAFLPLLVGDWARNEPDPAASLQ